MNDSANRTCDNTRWPGLQDAASRMLFRRCRAREHRTRSCVTVRIIMTATLLLGGLAGCADPAAALVGQVERGAYGKARASLSGKLETSKSSRQYMYHRMYLMLVNLADGLPEAAEPLAEQMFDILRTQGINEDKTIASVVLWEGVKFWKGEPFEQAMMFTYVAVQKAMSDKWDSARSAGLNALFLLKDFDAAEGTAAALAQEAAEWEEQHDGRDYFEQYTAARTNFVPGYLITGVANAVLGFRDSDRAAEAREHFASAVRFNPALRPVVDRIQSGQYNTVLVVDYGLGPTKYGHGPDNVFADYRQARGWPSGTEQLRVEVNGRHAGGVPVACDLNALATDHKWRSIEDVRKAKSTLGTLMLAGGGAMVAFGDNDVQLVGAIIAAIGLYNKATAAADVQYCKILPQRMYVVPLTLAQPDSVIALRVGSAQPCIRLAGVSPPIAPDRVQLRYVRVPASHVPQPWAVSGHVYYANDHYDQVVDGDDLPYILGGRCVRTPTHEVLAYYQSRGHLQDVTLDELREMYRAEGIVLEVADDQLSQTGVHVLEGGTSLLCPLPGTTGYARLFGQEHARHAPRSRMVRKRMQQLIASGSVARSAR